MQGSVLMNKFYTIFLLMVVALICLVGFEIFQTLQAFMTEQANIYSNLNF